ncbi:MAG TPA: agmatine deiminase [Kineosporiaceae bacterium]
MPVVLSGTPADDGFWMPAEWEQHDGCYLVWPERPDNWRGGGKPAQATWVRLVEAIATGERVTVLASSRQWRNARHRLPAAVRVVEATTDDAWVRDSGPTFVVDGAGRRRAVDWAFNAWGGLRGGLFFPWDSDDVLGHKMAELEGADCYQPPLVMEGGSFDADGEGTLLVTEECLLNPNRNPDLDRDRIEGYLRSHLGVSQVVWLPRGVHLDETDGHVDNFARFVAPGVVVLTWTDDRSDPQYERSAEALEILRDTTDARGRRLRVVPLHQPGPLHATAAEVADLDVVRESRPRTAGERLAGSYVNCYLGNGIVVVPVFDDPHDAAALQAYADLLPGRRVIPVPGREILLGGGNVHCVTQQVPSP